MVKDNVDDDDDDGDDGDELQTWEDRGLMVILDVLRIREAFGMRWTPFNKESSFRSVWCCLGRECISSGSHREDNTNYGNTHPHEHTLKKPHHDSTLL